jgi:hypothetical protein
MMADIQFKTLKVDQIKNSSGIFSGQNAPYNWNHTGKTSEGFGKVAGNGNVISRNFSSVSSSKAEA